MILRVGAFLYRVRHVPGYIEHEGQRCVGLCDNDAHEILVSDVVSPAQQIQVIGHEYMEAWLYHFGQNLQDKEDYCDLFGMAMAQLVLDLTHQLRCFAAEAEGEAPTRGGEVATEDEPTGEGEPTGGRGVESSSGAAAGVGAGSGPGASPRGSLAPKRVRAGARRGLSGLANSTAHHQGHDRSSAEAPEAAPAPAAVATKLAAKAAQLGLRVRYVHEPGGAGDPPPGAAKPASTEPAST